MEIETDCCIVGGGPAGMMLGLMLARADIRVTVLEKHADFARDFRGDTIHPSTLDVLDELGLLDLLLALPHQELQGDFLDFLAREARRYRTFNLVMQADVDGLITGEDGVVSGVHAQMPDGALTVRAPLVVGCDGRESKVRALAGLTADELGAPIDVLWLRIPRAPDDTHELLGRVPGGRALVMLESTAHWQSAYLIQAGGIEAVRAAGIERFRDDLAALTRSPRARFATIEFDDVKALTVHVDRLRRWYKKGLLCIGDAAHAMSPVGGVGINLAIQDAVAAANLLAMALQRGRVSVRDLARVQQRRMWPTRATQRLQIFLHEQMLGTTTSDPPAFARALARWPALGRIPARLIGKGFRPEHVAAM